MDRLVLFTDRTFVVSPLFIKATLQAAQSRDDVEVAAVCIRNPQRLRHRLRWYARTMMARRIQGLFDSNLRQIHKIPWPINLIRLARQHGFEVLVPPDHNVNHREFIELLKTRIRPTLALSYYSMQKFSPALLDVFEYPANYHNSHLPKYKGLHATRWSVYHGEKETGFTFHRMKKAFDDGPILHQGTVPVRPNASVVDLDYEKAVEATKYLPRLLEMLVNRETGRPQEGKGSYFSQKDFLHITTIDDPSRYRSAELMKRLRAFDRLLMRINGTWYEVTKLEEVSQRPGRPASLCFRTADGIIMQATRIQYLPFFLYQILRWMRWALRSRR